MPSRTARAVNIYTDLPGNSFSENFQIVTADSVPGKDSKRSSRVDRVRSGSLSSPSRTRYSKGSKHVESSLRYMANRAKDVGLEVLNQLIDSPKKAPSHKDRGITKAPAVQPAVTNNRSRHEHERDMALLGGFEIVFLVDDSTSMGPNKLWKEVSSALGVIAQTAVQYDSNGIDIFFCNTTSHSKGLRSLDDVEALFRSVQPIGATSPLEKPMEYLLKLYIDGLEHCKRRRLPLPKPLNLVVITRGKTDCSDTLVACIANIALRLEKGCFSKNQVGIQFVQLGQEKQATEFLKRLDNVIKTQRNYQRDMVDTVPYTAKETGTGEFVLEAVLVGVNRRIARERTFSKS